MVRFRLKNNKRGFTLVEVMVVIAIISLLSSMIFAALSVAKGKGQDARAVVEAESVKTAVASYVIDHNSAPPNFNCSGSSCVVTTERAAIAVEDISNPTNPSTESGKAYNASMNVLVSGGYLASVPHSVTGTAPYEYYNFPSGTVSSSGGTVIFGTTLNSPNTSPNNCRIYDPCPQGYSPDYAIQQCVASDSGLSELCAYNPFYTYNNNSDYCSCSTY